MLEIGNACYIDNDYSTLYLIMTIDKADYFKTEKTQVVLRDMKTGEYKRVDCDRITDIVEN